jgi:hypothetical protein
MQGDWRTHTVGEVESHNSSDVPRAVCKINRQRRRLCRNASCHVTKRHSVPMSTQAMSARPRKRPLIGTMPRVDRPWLIPVVALIVAVTWVVWLARDSIWPDAEVREHAPAAQAGRVTARVAAAGISPRLGALLERPKVGRTQGLRRWPDPRIRLRTLRCR